MIEIENNAKTSEAVVKIIGIGAPEIMRSTAWRRTGFVGLSS